jgi:hypothetical protein
MTMHWAQKGKNGNVGRFAPHISIFPIASELPVIPNAVRNLYAFKDYAER